MHAGAVKLGCPVWAHTPWVGSFFTADARREDFLPQYASVFDAAEGNATFYGLPAPATVARWAEEAPATFGFCFKFPKTVSHENTLRGDGAGDGPLVRAFLDRLAPLGPRRGPLMLQLSSHFGPARLGDLREWLARLPRADDTGPIAVAVEVRHAEFFAGGAAEDDLHATLKAADAERCVFDTSGLFAAKVSPDDESAQDALRRKPRVAVRRVALGAAPMVRFVGDPVVENNDKALDRWAADLSRWIDEGRSPYFFVHHPDELHAPSLGRRLQAKLHALRPARVPAPPCWPIELRPPAKSVEPAQLDLF